MKALVLGANGFLGRASCQALNGAGWQVIGLDHILDEGTDKLFDIRLASVFDGHSLRDAMTGIDVVFCFHALTIPSMTPGFLGAEVQTTLRALEYILSVMVEVGAQRIVFPSSGGTIYGDIGERPAQEFDDLRPLSAYGMGKLLSELMIQFYARAHGVKFTILRLANAYGMSQPRHTPQGLIDVFLDQLLRGETPVLWGSGDNVRDFIFVDDVMSAMLKLLEVEPPASLIVNVGTGIGTTAKEVLSVIGRVTGTIIEEKHAGLYPGVAYNVLDVGLLQSLTKWVPAFNLEDGIRETWARKSGRVDRDDTCM